MQLDPAEMRPVVNRIKRAHGQLAGALRMLEEARGPATIHAARAYDAFCEFAEALEAGEVPA